MRQLTPVTAVLWGGLVAGLLDLGAVFAFWIWHDVMPSSILQSIASSLLGRDAYALGAVSAALGLFLHFAVSFAFAAAYVLVSGYVAILRARPIPFGLGYGVVAYFIMSFVIVPLSRAEFGGDWPPPPLHLAASLFIHLVLFGLPIALAASRIGSRGSGPGLDYEPQSS